MFLKDLYIKLPNTLAKIHIKYVIDKKTGKNFSLFKQKSVFSIIFLHVEHVFQ